MTRRFRLGAAMGLLLTLSALAAPAASASRRPDLSGIWTSNFLTELERPPSLKTLTISDAEAAAYERQRPLDILREQIDDVGGRQSESSAWEIGTSLARIDGKARTSWLVDPANGRLPYNAGGIAAQAAAKAAAADTANPEARSITERCLLPVRGLAGPPMLNAPYTNLLQIVQTPQAVAIALENNHEVRIIRLDTRRHLPPTIRPWMGDSIGRWEGGDLVVETTNRNVGETSNGPYGLFLSKDAKVTERFRRLSPVELLYEFSVDDPATYTQVWRGQMVLKATKGPIYEYACHEGNYSLPGILAGGRREEATAARARAEPAEVGPAP